VKIAIIHWGCVRHDAISNLVRQHVLWCLEAGHDAIFLGQRCDDPDLPFARALTTAEAEAHPFFKACELAVLHFGIRYSLFDLLRASSRQMKRLAIFHNITPKEHLNPTSWQAIEESFAQMNNIRYADKVICISETNRSVLLNAGIDTPSMVLPISVDAPLPPPVSKPGFGSERINMVFIGRFVKSKGPEDLLDAIALAVKVNSCLSIELDMIGNTEMSDPRLLVAIEARIATLKALHGSRISIRLRLDIDDETKYGILSEADIFALPSRHEGFCVPIIEALAMACRVIAYGNSNISSICGGHGRLVPTGDIARLADAIIEEAIHVRSVEWQREGYRKFTQLTATHASRFRQQIIKPAFLEALQSCFQQTSLTAA
jgi:glycosyltransferase involved in cell wall biosynthesis